MDAKVLLLWTAHHHHHHHHDDEHWIQNSNHSLMSCLATSIRYIDVAKKK